MTDSELNRAIAKVIARFWADKRFKAQLLADPALVLRENGIPVKDGLHVNIVQDTPTEAFFVIPPKPEDLADNDLNAALVGIRCSSSYFCCGHGT